MVAFEGKVTAGHEICFKRSNLLTFPSAVDFQFSCLRALVPTCPRAFVPFSIFSTNGTYHVRTSSAVGVWPPGKWKLLS